MESQIMWPLIHGNMLCKTSNCACHLGRHCLPFNPAVLVSTIYFGTLCACQMLVTPNKLQ